jgi:hypothetical protein
MATAYFDGNSVFGLAVKVQQTKNPSAQQINAFFGVTGTQMIYGGGRGRVFMISGVLIGSDLTELNAAESTLLSYDDGIARTLTDPWGRSWPYVVSSGDYHADPAGPRPFDGGWAIAYRCTFRGLA